MALHYKTPILLIEFDENKSFSLQVTQNNTQKKWRHRLKIIILLL